MQPVEKQHSYSYAKYNTLTYSAAVSVKSYKMNYKVILSSPNSPQIFRISRPASPHIVWDLRVNEGLRGLRLYTQEVEKRARRTMIHDFLVTLLHRMIEFQIPKMSRFLFIFLAFASIFTTGCVPVTFDEPMPMNRRNLDHFPSSLQGSWASEDDDVMLHIFRDHFSLQESIFLSDSVILRKYKKKFVVSVQLEENKRFWEVFQASLAGDSLTLLTLSWKDEDKKQKIQSILGDRLEIFFDGDIVDSTSFLGRKDSVSQVHASLLNNSEFKELMEHCADTIGTYIRVQTGI
ncbi:MAG: hypothetical protein HOH96_05415 [Flavobacteriales bacterium]|jgi:hypothetical protein|nr:hypothetical protein [Flavobacteriales bacterium]